MDGRVKGTRVVLSNDEGAIYPVSLEPDKIELSNSELEELALNIIYQKNFRDKYENEKFKEFNEKIANYEELINKMNQSMEESDKMLQLATATLNELISNMYPDEGGTDKLPDKDDVGIVSTTTTYAVSTSDAEEPTSGWSDTIPDVPAGQYLWTKTVLTYTDGTSETKYQKNSHYK